jgi:hypothetical protein
VYSTLGQLATKDFGRIFHVVEKKMDTILVKGNGTQTWFSTQVENPV